MISENDDQLLCAIGYGALATVKTRLRGIFGKGANPNVISPKHDGLTPLVLAAMGGHAEIAKELIAAGADVNWTGYQTGTPLYWAVQEGHAEVVKVLLDSGVDPTAKCYGDEFHSNDPLKIVAIHSAVRDLSEVEHLLRAAIEARTMITDSQRLHEEGQRQSEEKARADGEIRQHQADERVRSEEDVRRTNLRAERKRRKQCELCGVRLGLFDRFFGRVAHRNCEHFSG